MEAIKPKKSLVDQTYDALLGSICTGELLPGERLNQDEIALKLNVSRQPVNSAVAILRANGLVEDTGRRGVVVAAVDPDHFQSIYEFRAIVEPFAVMQAGARMKREYRREAESVLKNGTRAVKKGDAIALLREDMNFHEMIYRWSGNQVIDPASARPTWDEHSEIIIHLLNDDAKAAAKAMKHHIERAGKETLKVLLTSDDKA